MGWQRCQTDADAVYIWLSLSTILLPIVCLISRVFGNAPQRGASGYAGIGAVSSRPSQVVSGLVACISMDSCPFAVGLRIASSRSKRLKRVHDV
jgi:hypothetical protein